MRLWCFGALDCPEEYDCPQMKDCRAAAFAEHGAVPLAAVPVVRRLRLEKAGVFAWERRIRK